MKSVTDTIGEDSDLPRMAEKGLLQSLVSFPFTNRGGNRCELVYDPGNPTVLIVDVSNSSLRDFGFGSFILGSALLLLAVALPWMPALTTVSFVLGLVGILFGFLLVFSTVQIHIQKDHEYFNVQKLIVVPLKEKQCPVDMLGSVRLSKGMRNLNGYAFFEYTVALCGLEGLPLVELDCRSDFHDARQRAKEIARYLSIPWIDESVPERAHPVRSIVGRESRRLTTSDSLPSGGLVLEFDGANAKVFSSAFMRTIWCMAGFPGLVVSVLGVTTHIYGSNESEIIPAGILAIGMGAFGLVLLASLVQVVLSTGRKERLLISHDRLRLEESRFVGSRIVEVSAGEIIDLAIDGFEGGEFESGLEFSESLNFSGKGILVRSKLGNFSIGVGQPLSELQSVYGAIRRTLTL